MMSCASHSENSAKIFQSKLNPQISKLYSTVLEKEVGARAEHKTAALKRIQIFCIHETHRHD